MTSALLIDAVLLIALIATCSFCYVVNRRLAVLKAGQKDLASAISVFDKATRRAEETLQRVEDNGLTGSRSLQQSMNRAEALATELSVMVSAGERMADRLEDVLGNAQKVSTLKDIRNNIQKNRRENNKAA